MTGLYEVAFIQIMNDAAAGEKTHRRTPRGQWSLTKFAHTRQPLEGRIHRERAWSTSLFPQGLSIRNMLNGYTAKYGIISEVALDEMVVGGPTHPRRLLRNRPVIQIG